MNTEEARQLLIKYNAGECTDAEKAVVEGSFFDYNEHEIDISQEKIVGIGKLIYSELSLAQNGAKGIKLWKGIAAIAAITVLSLSTWHIFDRVALPPERIIVRDVRPGTNKATITLGNGEIITLKGSKNGIVVNGKDLVYQDGSEIVNGDNSSTIQTLSTPKGGQYQIELPDGTKVWLNAASSLKYPTSFVDAKERGVELTGEAYFEVAPDKAKPFMVKSPKQTVEVLGTHFNLNNYNDRGFTITTLLEGCVKVTNSLSQQVILKPNQQSLITDNHIKVQDADLETALAWKNGRIEFKDADIRTIMTEISRWYNIEVEYRGDISKRTFDGSISRTSNLSVLLKILAYSDIHFEIEQDQNSNKKLIVTP
ncbi:MAG: FecR domain-containing protein [Bacteroidota bacterium]